MKYFLILLCLFSCFISSQDTWTAFSIDKCILEKHIYPWGEELSLEIRGIANSQLQGEYIDISISFNNNVFQSYNIILNKSKYNSIHFSLSEEPINTPHQRIIPGVYTIFIELRKNKNNSIQKEKFKELSSGRAIRSYTYSFSIGTEEEQKNQSKEEKIFYLKQIRTLNNILDDIFIQQKFVFQPKRPNNPYYQKTEKFNMQAWRSWFQKINAQFDEEKRLLRQHSAYSFVLVYPRTHQYLYTYTSLLEDIAGKYANAVYKFKKEPNAKFIPPYKMDELYEELNGIYNMHQEMQKELKVNLKKVLGYFPPPPVLRP